MDAYLWKSHKCVDFSAEIICLQSNTVSLQARFQKVGTLGGCKSWNCRGHWVSGLDLQKFFFHKNRMDGCTSEM